MSSKANAAAKKIAAEPKRRPTNEELFQQELQHIMKKYGCAIQSSPEIGFDAQGVLRITNMRYGVVKQPAQPAAPATPAPAKAPAKK